MAQQNPVASELPADRPQTPPPPFSAHDPNPVQKPQTAYSQHPQPAYSTTPTYVTPLAQLGDQAAIVDCPFCRKIVKTQVQKEDSSMTIVAGVVLCLVCVCLACLPCILGWCQNTKHFCGTCGKQLTFRPSDGMVQVCEEARNARNASAPGKPLPGQVPSQYPTPQAPANARMEPPVQQLPLQEQREEVHPEIRQAPPAADPVQVPMKD